LKCYFYPSYIFACSCSSYRILGLQEGETRAGRGLAEEEEEDKKEETTMMKETKTMKEMMRKETATEMTGT
jgi:hypothetical protein